jgi:large subunit ribosomal protein L10
MHMPKSKEQKRETIKKISAKIRDSKSVFFTRYSKLTVAESTNIREELKREGGEFLVAPKTLTNLALKENKMDGIADTRKYEGQMALVFGFGDEVAPAKAIDRFRNEHPEKIEFMGGILDGKLLGGKEVGELAKLPSKIELYARLVGSIGAPASGFVNVLTGNFRKLVYALKAIEEKK